LKKILFVRKSNLQTGGVEMQMIRAAVWLRDHRIASSVLATDDLSGKLAALFRDHGFEVIFCPLNGKGYALRAVQILIKAVRTYGITHLQAHMFRESMVCRYVKLFQGGVVNVFRIETYIDCSSISSLKKTLYHFLALITQDLVDHYLPNGNLVRAELEHRSHVTSGNIKVIFNGVESFGEPDLEPISSDASGFVDVVMVANFIRGKGHELLFDAIALLKSESKHLRISLYGDDLEPAKPGVLRYGDELRTLTEKLNITDRVLFKGFTSDLRNELRRFSTLLLPSFSEGTPNTVLEAMSVRKLVIVSDAGELPYMVEHMKSGLVHRKGDLRGLTDCLRQLFNPDQSLINEIRTCGYERWKSHFSLDHVMTETASIYE